MAKGRLRDQIENLRTELWLVARAKQNVSDISSSWMGRLICNTFKWPATAEGILPINWQISSCSSDSLSNVGRDHGNNRLSDTAYTKGSPPTQNCISMALRMAFCLSATPKTLSAEPPSRQPTHTSLGSFLPRSAQTPYLSSASVVSSDSSDLHNI